MSPARIAAALIALGLLPAAVLGGRAGAATVLMISIDGLKPEYVTQADQRGLKIPTLRGLMADGAYADGVAGVWPTNTYPSHTTLVTGVTPAVHGIYNNPEFDPKRKFAESWFWYARQIRVPTLWQAAHHAGLATASIGWPATVGSTDVDFLIPEYWRIFRPTEDLNPSDRYLIAALTRPEGMLEQMQQSLGPYLMGNDVSLEADESKTRFAIDILVKRKPRFMTLHLGSLDYQEHEHGPFSAAANQDLEGIDGMLGRLIAASRSSDPEAIIVVVSDHGFVELTHRVNLGIPFVQAGLIEASIDPATQAASVNSWTAEPWMASGMAAVMLRDPGDRHVLTQVRELLGRISREPAWGIDEILDAEAMQKRGGFPGASFVISMKPGYYTGGNLSGDAVTGFAGHGGHGFAPHHPDMRAALFIAGRGIARHRDLGQIDMRQVAPTVAALLGVKLTSATAAPLPVRQ
jgi:predicted AlkP superfamily pyrophosphatase or phosphodiesterase